MTNTLTTPSADNKKQPKIVIRQCPSCRKIFGYVKSDKDYQLCDTCQKQNNWNNFIQNLNIFKNKQ